MIAAFWAVVGKIAKKVLVALAGDKKGRKFLGYVIGIALFIVLLPVIAVYGLFGWMAGGGATEIIDYNAVCEYIIDQFDLTKPIFKKTSAYGHFNSHDFPWEKTDAVPELMKVAI